MSECHGLVTKNQNGYYSVVSEGRHYLCKVRGKMKRGEQRVLVGDRVSILPLDDTQAMITSIAPRRNQLLRPPVANLDQALIVASAASPPINLPLLDRLILMCVSNGITPILCFTKMDLQPPEMQNILAIYHKLPYDVCPIDYREEQSGEAVLEALRKRLEGKITIVCGQSGVGKSTLLNSLAGREWFPTQAISERIGRGKNTTRHVVIRELYSASYIADTPGFMSLDYLPSHKEDIANGFYEIGSRQGHCRFDNCTHRHEPDCKIKAAVDEGQISQERYRSYLLLVAEQEEREREMYR